MRIIIEKLEKGHLVIIEDENGTRQLATGKWHDLANVLRKLLYKKPEKK